MNLSLKSKLFNRCFSIALAMLLCMALAVPAFADETTGIITLAYSYGSGPNEITIGERWSPGDSDYYGFCVDYLCQPNYTYIYEVKIVSEVPNTTSINYTGRITDVKLSLDTKWGGSNYLNNFTIEYNYDSSTLTHTYLIPFNTANLPLNTFKYLTVWTARGTTVPDIYQYSSANVYITYDPNQSEFDRIMNQLGDIQSNQENNNIILGDILQQQIINNENWTQIINYGSDYNQISSTLINNLGSAENQLSSAEDALENKSSSLRDSVSSQWQQSTQTARSFVNTITPATAAITNTVTSVVTAMPAEVQTLLTVLPLLLFIGWLIGRVGGG